MVSEHAHSGGVAMTFAKETPVLRFLSPGKLRPTSIGYDLEKKAAIGIGLDSFLYGSCNRILVFGLAGSGMSGFVEYVLQELTTKYSVPIDPIELNCENIILENEMSKTIRDVQKRTDEAFQRNAKDGTLSILIIEKPEALSSEIENFLASKTVAKPWLSLFLRRSYSRTLIFFTSDDPSKMDLSLSQFAKIPIYLSPLDLKSLQEIFKGKLKRQDSGSIAEYLHKAVEDDGFRLVSAEVVKATEKAMQEVKDFNDLSIGVAAASVRERIFPCYPIEEVEAYERRNADWISHARNFVLAYWPSKLEELRGRM